MAERESRAYQEPKVIPFHELVEADIVERTGGTITSNSEGTVRGVKWEKFDAYMSLTGAKDPHVSFIDEDGKAQTYSLRNAQAVVRQDSITVVRPQRFFSSDGSETTLFAQGLTIVKNERMRSFSKSIDAVLLRAAEKAESQVEVKRTADLSTREDIEDIAKRIGGIISDDFQSERIFGIFFPEMEGIRLNIVSNGNGGLVIESLEIELPQERGVFALEESFVIIGEDSAIFVDPQTTTHQNTIPARLFSKHMGYCRLIVSVENAPEFVKKASKLVTDEYLKNHRQF